MRRVLMITTGLILLVFLSGCSSRGDQNIFGVYTFEEVSYLSPFSSSTKDHLNSQMEGSKYTIEEDLFKIESKEHTVEYSSPKYVKEYIKEKIPDESTIFSDVYTFMARDVDYRYAIYDKNDNKTV